MAEDSLRRYMDGAVERYRRLFNLPPSRKALSFLALLCVGGGVFSVLTISPSIVGLVDGLFLGCSSYIISLAVDYAVQQTVMKKDTIFNFRRTVVLSLVCWVFWFCFVFVGTALARLVDFAWWVRLCLLGFSAATILRFLVMSAISSLSRKRSLSASYFQPFACIIPFLILWVKMGYLITFYLPAYFIFSLIISLVSVSLFLTMLDRLGRTTLRMRSLALFRAFMLNWVLGLNAPLEELLEKLGEEREVEISLLKFDSPKSKVVMVVPSVHPGPFRNIGSSPLPSLLKSAIEKELGCIACVPHGLLGHEFDLASQHQNRKVIDKTVAAVNGAKAFEHTASPFVKVDNGLATACCQVFGKSVFTALTLAPRTIEDLPQEVGFHARREAERQGLTLCAVVNAHNSIDSTPGEEECLASLMSAATACLEKAASLDQSSLKVGAASIMPKEFRLEDGMGLGGITVVVIGSGEQKAAYVVIDGNNMVSGLREKLLDSLRVIGVDDGEVFTTDTHSVSALLTGQGYHPIGEAIDHERLIGYVKEAAEAAISNMQGAEVACETVRVSGVKVIGANRLEALCVLIDKGAKRAKRMVGPIFIIAGLFLMFFLLLV